MLKPVSAAELATRKKPKVFPEEGSHRDRVVELSEALRDAVGMLVELEADQRFPNTMDSLKSRLNEYGL